MADTHALRSGQRLALRTKSCVWYVWRVLHSDAALVVVSRSALWVRTADDGFGVAYFLGVGADAESVGGLGDCVR